METAIVYWGYIIMTSIFMSRAWGWGPTLPSLPASSTDHVRGSLPNLALQLDDC